LASMVPPEDELGGRPPIQRSKSPRSKAGR
jgi:hypothetical protein